MKVDYLTPRFLGFCKYHLIDYLTKSTRTKFRAEIQQKLGKTDDDLANETACRQELVDFLESLGRNVCIVGEDDASPGQAAGGIDVDVVGGEVDDHVHPPVGPLNAAQCSTYAFLERLVGDMGDAGYFCSIPELREERKLEKIWHWYDRVRAAVPVRFKGKRARAAGP